VREKEGEKEGGFPLSSQKLYRKKKITRQIRARKKAGSVSQWIRKRCQENGITEPELRSGSRRRDVSELRKEICLYLNRELGIPMAEIAREVGIGTTGVAMIIKRREEKNK
jgi:DNA-binding MarR family transcriptional regulator